MYDEVNIPSKETIRALKKAIRNRKSSFGERIIKRMKQSGIKITIQHKLALFYDLDIELLPENKSYYTHAELLECYKYFLSKAVEAFLEFAEIKMKDGTYVKSEFLDVLKQCEAFVVNQQIAKAIKIYLLNRFRSFKHKTETEKEFKIARNIMGWKYYELQKAYKVQ